MLGVNPAQEQAALGNLAADCQDTKESNDVAEEPDQPQQPPPSWGQHRYFATNQKLFDTAGKEYAADSMVNMELNSESGDSMVFDLNPGFNLTSKLRSMFPQAHRLPRLSSMTRLSRVEPRSVCPKPRHGPGRTSQLDASAASAEIG
jgi:hypothetical protein